MNDSTPCNADASDPCSSKNPSPRIPKMCRHKASGRGVVRLDGRDHYLKSHAGAHEKKQLASGGSVG